MSCLVCVVQTSDVAVQGFYTCLKLLVQRCGQPGLPDNDQVTPCHLATQRAGNKCLPLLIKHLSSEALNAEDCNKVQRRHIPTRRPRQFDHCPAQNRHTSL